MIDPVERVARFLWTLKVDAARAAPLEADWDRFLPEARALIASLREPTEMMIDAGAEFLRADAADLSEVAGRDDTVNIWRAMIDTALGG